MYSVIYIHTSCVWNIRSYVKILGNQEEQSAFRDVCIRCRYRFLRACILVRLRVHVCISVFSDGVRVCVRACVFYRMVFKRVVSVSRACGDYTTRSHCAAEEPTTATRHCAADAFPCAEPHTTTGWLWSLYWFLCVCICVCLWCSCAHDSVWRRDDNVRKSRTIFVAQRKWEYMEYYIHADSNHWSYMREYVYKLSNNSRWHPGKSNIT